MLWLLFKPKRVRRGREKKKKKLLFQSILTGPGIEYSKKIAKKLKKHHYDFISRQNGLGEAEKEKKKIVVPISSYPTKNREFQKKSKKFKNIIMASCQAKTGRD